MSGSHRDYTATLDLALVRHFRLPVEVVVIGSAADERTRASHLAPGDDPMALVRIGTSCRPPVSKAEALAEALR